MLSMERHSLLRLSPEGYAQAWKNHREVCGNPYELWRAFPDLPAIYTGRKERRGLLSIGFSYPLRQGESRCRMGSAVEERFVARTISPWGLMKSAAEQLDTVRAVAVLAERHGLSCGVFGATGMQAATGLAYLHPGSDLDIVLDRAEPEKLESFFRELAAWERRENIPVDAEVRLAEQCYCKLKELFSHQSTVLCKGGEEPVLRSRRDVFVYLRSGGENLNKIK